MIWLKVSGIDLDWTASLKVVIIRRQTESSEYNGYIERSAKLVVINLRRQVARAPSSATTRLRQSTIPLQGWERRPDMISSSWHWRRSLIRSKGVMPAGEDVADNC